MDEETLKELGATVAAYMTSGLRENPSGISLQYFNSTFAKLADEPDDWYKKFNATSVVSALQLIPGDVILTTRGNQTYITLNPESKNIDPHMIDLVTNQRAKSGPKRTKGPSYASSRSAAQRAVDSFGLNRRYSMKQDFSTENRFGSRFQQRTSVSAQSRERMAPTRYQSSRPTVYNDTQQRAVPGDPRARHAVSSPIVPPQVRLSSSTHPSATASKQAPLPPQSPVTNSAIRPISRSSGLSNGQSYHRPLPTFIPGKLKSTVKDPDQDVKIIQLRDNLVDLLTNKYETLKLFHLASIYKEEYKEDLDPTRYGHKTITDLLKNRPLCNHLKIVPDHPFSLVKAINIGEKLGKENGISSRASNSNATNDYATKDPLKDKSNILSASKAKYDAINPFNVRAMLQSLEPLTDIKGPTLGRLKIEDTVKYRTMRVIFKSPDMTLKLDDWERKYQIDWGCTMRIPIQDYGFKSLLEFFKELAHDIPIKISLKNDDWVAKSDFESVSEWLNKTMANGNYKAIMVMDKRYDSAAMPTDSYKSFDLSSLKPQKYYPVTIMSIKPPCKMWLQFKTQEQIAALLSIESSLSSYEDYKRKGILQVPREFMTLGFPCVAFDDVQKRWCRASIIPPAPEGEHVNTFLVDYGLTRKIKRSQILCILKAHLAQPVGIIYAQLTKVREDAEKGANVILHELTNPPVQLACEIHDQYPTKDADSGWQAKRFIHDVSLVDTRQNEDCDLATTINSSTQFSPPDDA